MRGVVDVPLLSMIRKSMPVGLDDSWHGRTAGQAYASRGLHVSKVVAYKWSERNSAEHSGMHAMNEAMYATHPTVSRDIGRRGLCVDGQLAGATPDSGGVFL